MTMEMETTMKFQDLKRMLDRKATYFWEKRDDGRYALVNAFTLKTATGCPTRIDALKLQTSLKSEGYNVAELADGMVF